MSGEGSAPVTWPVLDVHERRVLGVLIEKAKTTPDAYPMSINAIVTGSNQKSAREPVLSLTDLDVEDALACLQKKGAVTRITGGRVERWRHDLYDAWKLDKVDLALICELLLRGPQTEGELRSRVSRMETFDDLDRLRAALEPLVKRGLAVYLTPQGRRGTMLTHGFHELAELEQLRKRADSGEEPPPTPAPSPPSVLKEVQAEIARLSQDVAALQQTVTTLEEQLREVRLLVSRDAGSATP
jgi:uncharacterized protein YceH (UPF0502 family)